MPDKTSEQKNAKLVEQINRAQKQMQELTAGCNAAVQASRASDASAKPSGLSDPSVNTDR